MFYYQDQNQIRQGTPEKFRELTGAEWADGIRVDAEAKKALHPSSISDMEYMRYLRPLYQMYKKNPPQLFLRVGKAKGCHSVHALQPIPKGTVVMEYLGEWSPVSVRHTSYRWGPIDGLDYRNFGAMVEDGFPNLAPFHLYHVDDLSMRVVFIAIEDIAEGDMLTVHYGMNHTVKIHYHDEYRQNELCSFFTEHTLQKLFDRLKELRKKSIKDLGWKKSLELENIVAKIRYLYQTPSALLLLLLKGIISPAETFQYYKDGGIRYFFLSFPYQANRRQQEIIDAIERIQKYFEVECRDDTATLEMLGSLRQRILSSLYLQGIINGELSSELKNESYLWNDAFDAIYQGNKALAECKIKQTQRREELLRQCLIYAKEIQSPLVSWLELFACPDDPISAAH